MIKLLKSLPLAICLTPHASSFLFDLSTFAPGAPNGKIQLPGPNVDAKFGYAVSGGDINGDGLNDIIIGGCTPGSTDQVCKNIVYVLFGSKTNLFQVNLTNLSPSQGFTIKAAKREQPTFSGVNNFSTGDFNGDGIDDIVIGDPTFSSQGRSLSGTAYVIFGSRGNLPNIDLNNPLSPTQGFQIFGGKASDYLGDAVSYAGDVNGDGISDIILGANIAYTSKGAAYILYGSKKTPSSIDLNDLQSTQGVRIIGGNIFDSFGDSVSNAGDINGDGIDDVIIGGTGCEPYDRKNAGAAFVIFGSKNLVNIDDVDNLTPSQGFKISGAQLGDALGNAVSAAGDVNADGIDDVIIGASSAGPLDRLVAGSAYVIFGSKTDLTDIDLHDTRLFTNKKGFRIVGAAKNDALGNDLAGVGDVNGDGIDDVLMGAWGRNEGTGAAYVIFGSKNGFFQIDTDKLNSKQGVLIMGDNPVDNFGCGVANAGDVNGDGVNDLIVGACSANRGGNDWAGAAYVILTPVGSDAIVM